MPAQLPSHPNLEHLKKQAKAFLEDFRKNEPQAVAKFGSLQLKASPKFSDAQHLVAREYGFENWSKLKEHVESFVLADAMQRAKKAFQADDAEAFRKVLERYPGLKKKINDPVGDFGSPIINHVRSKPMLDAVLDAGADINARSDWKPGSFGLLDSAPPDVAMHAIDRGAVVTIHAAARLGLFDKLKELIVADPQLVHARGGDGQFPLHFASTPEIAEYLLAHGADIDGRDIDHDSTAAQWMLRERPEVARYLVQRGCHTDILMAAALGDLELAKKHLDADPDCIRMRVVYEYFPLIDSGKNGGTIYQWQLGWYVSAVQVAKDFNHEEMLGFLMSRCPADEKLLDACWLHDEALVHSLLAANPDLANSLRPSGRRHVAHAARNNDTEAVRLMLEAGLPALAYGQHHATALHWAAFNGNPEVAKLLLRHNAPLENNDNQYQGKPIQWAMYGSEHGWHPETGDFAGVADVLLQAGAQIPDEMGGTEAVRAVLARYPTK